MSFAIDSSGTWLASFTIAGGAASGRMPLIGLDSQTIDDYDAFVADVQLGSYEPRNGADRRGGLICVVAPTYHFYCQATGVVDQFCLTWERRMGHGCCLPVNYR